MSPIDDVWEASDKLNAAVRKAVAGISFNHDPRDLSELILAERTRQGLSLQDVASRSGMAKSHIWEVEQGRSRNPTVGAMEAIAEALAIPFLQVCSAALRSYQR